MSKPFHVDVVSPEAVVWSGEAEFVVARTTEGEIGILADHEPTMAALATGTAEIETVDEGRVTIAAHGGFLQIFQNQVTLLSDRAVISKEGKEAAASVAADLAASAEDEDVEEAAPEQ